MHSALVCLLGVGPAIAAAATGEASAAAVTRAKVVGQRLDSAIVSIDVGRQADLAVGDRFWILDGTELLPGIMNFVADTVSAGRLANSPVAKVEGRAAIILHQALLSVLRESLPSGMTVAGRVSRLPPGRETAWIDIGSTAGLKERDGILIRRAGIPVARGEILVLNEDAALTNLQPLVGNALPEKGDRAELWPAPGLPEGAVNSAVLAVEPDPEGATVTFVGGLNAGSSEGRLADIRRNGQYIGVASVTAASPGVLTQARMIPSASLEQPKEGDEIVMRPPPGPPAPPLQCVIFRVEEDYCLIAAGEVDGVQRGERLSVCRREGATDAGKLIAEITIDKVNVDYSGALIRSMDPAGARTEPWDIAERHEPPWLHWKVRGRVESTDAAARITTITCEENSEIGTGDIVGLISTASPGENTGRLLGGGVVLSRDGRRAFAYVPPGWAEIQDLSNASIILSSTQPIAPASAPSSSVPAASAPAQ